MVEMIIVYIKLSAELANSLLPVLWKESVDTTILVLVN